MENNQELEIIEEPSFGDRLADFFVKFIKIFLRVLVILLLGIGLGAGLYFGVPALYNQFIEPVQVHGEQIADLIARQEQDTVQLTERLDDLQARLAALETADTEDAETFAELEARQDTLALALEQQDAIQEHLDTMQADIADLMEITGANASLLDELTVQVNSGDQPLLVLARDLQKVKALQVIGRARLDLNEGNAVAAAQNVDAALVILAQAAMDAPEEEADQIAAVVERLEMVQENLEAAPLIAANDLEVAWQLLLDVPLE